MTAADSSVNGNSGSLTGFSFDGTTNGWAPGKIGGALQFNGLNNSVNASVTPGLAAGADSTISIWVKPSVAQPDSLPVWLSSADNGIIFGSYGYDGRLFYAPGHFFSTSITFDNVWHLFTYAFTGSTSTMTLYIDGVRKEDATGYTQPAITYALFGVGFGHYFSGSLDDARIYTRALSATEVKQLYQGIF